MVEIPPLLDRSYDFDFSYLRYDGEVYYLNDYWMYAVKDDLIFPPD